MPSLNGHRATTVTGCLAGVLPWKDIHVHTRRRSKLVEEVFLLDAVGGIIYILVFLGIRKMVGKRHKAGSR
jgi:hypothetical protein